MEVFNINHTVTRYCEYETVPKLLNVTSFNDIE